MPKLELTVTELIDESRAQRLGTLLSAHLEVDGPHTFARRADLSTIPQYIQLIGPYADWLPLLAPATIFLTSYITRLGQISADATAALFKKQDVKPLTDVATALAEASAGRAQIVVGLDIPDPHFGTALAISAECRAEQIASALAAFVVHASELSAVMTAEVEAGRAPAARATITIEQDGSLTVRWRSRKDFADNEKRIP